MRLYTTLAAEAVEPDHADHEYFRRRNDIVRISLVMAVDRARECGNLPPGPPAEQVAAGIIAVMDGLQLQWLLDPGFDMVAAFDAHLQMIGARLAPDA
ncbi:TetR family transcriptional regulator C-terminal domain-containing protein [Streptomyces sp. NPDC000348]|uniref:TetR family transcriptional regulator C-terminal domain-containing protein n=1 Tax=Streptomyces sp. NPDC000348 TaxID=3364538 RepID=UPI0036B30267